MSKPLISDVLNRRLVALLQEEGRISHAELAERLGVSRPTIIERVKRLEAERVINGEFDATPEESRAWAESPDGQETFRVLADDAVFGGIVRDMERREGKPGNGRD